MSGIAWEVKLEEYAGLPRTHGHGRCNAVPPGISPIRRSPRGKRTIALPQALYGEGIPARRRNGLPEGTRAEGRAET